MPLTATPSAPCSMLGEEIACDDPILHVHDAWPVSARCALEAVPNSNFDPIYAALPHASLCVGVGGMKDAVCSTAGACCVAGTVLTRALSVSSAGVFAQTTGSIELASKEGVQRCACTTVCG